MRTTVDIDDPILAELKRLQKRDGRSLGRLVSDLLLQSLAQPTVVGGDPPGVPWGPPAMGLPGRDWKRPGYAAGPPRTVAAPTPDAAGTSRTLDRFQPGSP